ncbi:MAG: hypothetical protein J2P19_04540 [Pseudonocardia sp.]|nr:hypothetical protein [Pseudonocardia sp.]
MTATALPPVKVTEDARPSTTVPLPLLPLNEDLAELLAQWADDRPSAGDRCPVCGGSDAPLVDTAVATVCSDCLGWLAEQTGGMTG